VGRANVQSGRETRLVYVFTDDIFVEILSGTKVERSEKGERKLKA